MSAIWASNRHLAWVTEKVSARPVLSSEALTLLVCGYFIAVFNGPFWLALQKAGASAGLQFSMGLAVFALHGVLIGLLAWGRLTRPLLAVLLIVSSGASWYMSRYSVLFDVEMVRNVMRTDFVESRELLSFGMLFYIFTTGVLPAALVMTVRLPKVALWPGLRTRGLYLVILMTLAGCAIAISSQGIFALMRSDHALRYQITPGNYLVSLARAFAQDEAISHGPKAPVATDARQLVPLGSRRPRVLVLVVGETVRGDHWGLNGYARQTTPKLATLDVINFPDVQACGTSTEVSLPCMFSIQGRQNYDRAAIRSHESLLDVLARTGVSVSWRDNQSGCKGVCDGVGMEKVADSVHPELCRAGRCLDEVLLSGLPEKISSVQGDMLIVLHQLGNHGPNYFERYPTGYEKFVPTCRTPELSRCTREEVINAYDNAILYTDDFLSKAIGILSAQDAVDAAMLYVSDHGESLGEYGLFLHGAPYAIAPKQQLHVPMGLWMSEGFEAGMNIDRACLRSVASEPRSHDDLFHTILKIYDISTSVYRGEKDFISGCRQSIGSLVET